MSVILSLPKFLYSKKINNNKFRFFNRILNRKRLISKTSKDIGILKIILKERVL
jgi:hypothetical protein